MKWQDRDYVGVFLEEGQFYSGAFDITTGSGGYDPNRHEITRARVGFSFSDGYWRGDSSGEWVDVWLGSSQAWNHREVDGTHRYGFDWIWRGLNGTMLADLSDGFLRYSIQVENWRDGRNNDVWLKQAHLEVWGREAPRSHGVPDGGATVALLGLGLAAIFLIRRRLSPTRA